jgi:3-oxoacyl-[acyl-carrier-protein] synthase-1
MPGAYIRGMGLSCALGCDAQTCVTSMLAGQVQPVDLQLNALGDPLHLRFYRLRDEHDLFDVARMQRHIAPVVRAAVGQARLSAEEIRILPVFVGSSSFTIGQSESVYAESLARHPAEAVPMPITGYHHIAAYAQRVLGSVGDTYVYNTACTASANALLGAVRMLEQGWYRHALVIGAEFANLTTLTGFAGLQLLTEVLRPFDAKRQGIVLGEGIGAVVLSHIRGSEPVLRLVGGASNCDTYSITTANPDGHSVAAVLKQALNHSQIEPSQVHGIKAHGTGTPAGDTAEALGMQRIFAHPPRVCALKPYLGHTLGACGVNELVLFAGALMQGVLPATPDLQHPDPGFTWQPSTALCPAPVGHYLLNHFGFGGNNTVLVLEVAS